MKKIIISLILWLPMSLFGAQNVPAEFNEYVDLMCVMWRLAGATEYNVPVSNPYSDSVDKHFTQYSSHSAVQLAKNYYEKGVGYDAVASFGAMLQMTDDGRIAFNKSVIDDLDYRWEDEMKSEFLTELNAFYADTHFHEWFVANEALQKDIVRAFQKVSQQIDIEWLGKFFSNNANAEFRLIVCPLAGVNNYGVSMKRTDGTSLLCPVISCLTYEKGQYKFDSDVVLPIIVHEFCHPYCNPLIERYWEGIAPTAEKAFREREKQLSQQAYTNARIMMYETFVRASVIRYMQEHYTDKQVNVPRLVRIEEDGGFLLTGTMLEALTDYQAKRHENHDMTDFFPLLANAVNGFDIDRYNDEQAEREKQLVHYECNIKDGAENVPAGDMVVTITFDRPMRPSVSMGMTTEEFPEYKGYKWSDDQRTLSVTFHTEPNHTYGFTIMGQHIISQDGINAVSSAIVFKTAAE